MTKSCIMAHATGGGIPLYADHLGVSVFAEITTRRGSKFALCKKHLDRWLDLADDRPETEPREIVWLK